MVGVLQAYRTGASPFGTVGNQSSILFDNIRANAGKRFQDEKTVIDSAAEENSKAIDAQNERYISVKAQINNANIAVENGQESIATIRTTLLEIRTPVALAAEDGEDPEFRAGEFDTKLNFINNEADTGGPAFNLVGNINRVDFTPNSIEYRNNLGAGSTTLTGTYAGSDYRIRAADGSYWIPELGTDSITHRSTLQGVVQKTTLSDGTEVEKTASTRNALNIVSYNETTKEVTFEVTFDPGLPPETVTGTLERHGLGLMPAWFYEGLETQGGRQRAFADIEKAEVELTSAEARLALAAAAVKKDSQKVDQALDSLTQDKVKVLNTQLTQTQELQIKTAQQVQAMFYNLQTLSSQQQNYIQAFAGFVRSPFFQINIRA
ncbi:MAG: hypothetical protein SFV19_20025 [Rhodospirillaceae bacterium]|nr:hypothetical protein [Rhodospirillaceae bacterium]